MGNGRGTGDLAHRRQAKERVGIMKPWLVAHRGGSALAPENTLAAIEKAVVLGVDAVEVDVLRSRDGHLMVHHDETLARTAGCPDFLWDLDARDLGQLDVGSWFDLRFASARLPTLEEVAAVVPPHMQLLIDFKHGEERFPGLTQQVIQFARSFGAQRLAVLSIQHAFVLDIVRQMPEITGLCTFRTPPITDEQLRGFRDLPAGVGLGTHMRVLSPALLAVARETGRKVYLFTPNTRIELQVALRVGADAVITDEIELALALRRAGRDEEW
jgi:glycerophosphoryl diester phosphodiesterase